MHNLPGFLVPASGRKAPTMLNLHFKWRQSYGISHDPVTFQNILRKIGYMLALDGVFYRENF